MKLIGRIAVRMTLILGFGWVLYGAPNPATVCGVPASAVDKVVQFRIYWFGASSLGVYHPGQMIDADCLISDTLTAIGFGAIHFRVGRRDVGSNSEWISVQGGFNGSGPRALLPYFVDMERSISPVPRSFQEIWEMNRKTVEDRTNHRLPAEPKPNQPTVERTERYELPGLAPPASSSPHLRDEKFVNRAIDLVKADLQKNMSHACKCQVSVPTFGASDPILYVLVQFRDGQVAVDDFYRNPVDGEPLPGDFLYHSNDPSHRFLVARLKENRALVETLE